MGYTPLFDSIFRGSLCGKWPTLPVFMTILPLADKNGIIDHTYESIHALTGWPIELLRQAIEQLEQPDPNSRSSAEEGRRLVRLRPNTTWGWKVVNHALYKEKARKAAFDSARVADGRNTERMRTRDDPRAPAMTREHPLSNTNTNSNTDPREETPLPPLKGGDAKEREALSKARRVEGLDLGAFDRFLGYRVEIRKPLKPVSYPSTAAKLARYGPDQAAVVEQTIAEGWQGLFDLKQTVPLNGMRPTRYDQLMSALDRWDPNDTRADEAPVAITGPNLGN